MVWWLAILLTIPPSASPASVSDTYLVMFFDGFSKKVKARHLSKWTRENEQRFGASGSSGLRALSPAVAAAAPAPVGFVPEVLETKRKRKTNPIVEELLGPKRARRQVRKWLPLFCHGMLPGYRNRDVETFEMLDVIVYALVRAGVFCCDRFLVVFIDSYHQSALHSP